jgi:hypothetical protein
MGRIAYFLPKGRILFQDIKRRGVRLHVTDLPVGLGEAPQPGCRKPRRRRGLFCKSRCATLAATIV